MEQRTVKVKVTESNDQKRVVVTVIGELEYDTPIRRVYQIDQCTECAGRKRWRSLIASVEELVLDLSGVTFMSSPGISWIIWVLRERQKHGMPPIRIIESQQVKRVLELTMVTRAFRLEEEGRE